MNYNYNRIASDAAAWQLRDIFISALQHELMRSKVYPETARIEILERPDSRRICVRISVDVKPRFV